MRGGGWLRLGARERSFRFTLRNWDLETMTGKGRNRLSS